MQRLPQDDMYMQSLAQDDTYVQSLPQDDSALRAVCELSETFIVPAAQKPMRRRLWNRCRMMHPLNWTNRSSTNPWKC
jgi:hypothetical protein